MNGSRVLLLLMVVVATGLGIAWAGNAAMSDRPAPHYEVDRSTKCVMAGEQMRILHPHLLHHQRDRTVHLGERGTNVSLKACVDCHAGPGAGISAGAVVGQEGAFCESCHQYAAVRIDCFDCHRDKPSSTERAAVESGRAR